MPKRETRLKMIAEGRCPKCGSHKAKCDCQKASGKKRRQAAKAKAILHYGDRCQCCSEGNIAFLTIDHINGGGNNHRRKMGVKKLGSVGFYDWLIANNFPEGFRVLCLNCNMGVYWNDGVCPHKK